MGNDARGSRVLSGDRRAAFLLRDLGPVSAVLRHVVHHVRFYIAFAIGAIVFGAESAAGVPWPLHLIKAGDAFFVAYLLLIASFVVRATPDRHRDRASYGDEGGVLIFVITAAAIAVSLAAIFAVLTQKTGMDPVTLVLSVISVPLGWVMFHSVAALHYAHRFYSERPRRGEGREDMRGLAFPGTKEPVAWDFIYHSFVIGMTAQVSD